MLLINTATVFLADLTPTDLMEAKLRAKSNTWSTEAAIIVGSIAFLTILLLSWAYFVRKRDRHGRSGYQPRPSSSRSGGDRSSSNAQEGNRSLSENESSQPERRKKRRRRRPHRPRNPTLAETGGLPPVRPSESPDFD